MKHIPIATGACFFLFVFLVSPGFSLEEDAGNAIKIGVPLPLSGTKSPFGEILKESYLMAQEEINATGGIRQGVYAGYLLDFLFEDTRGKAETAREVAEGLIYQDNVPIMMGGYSSAAAFDVARVCERNRIPFICSSGAADEITQQGWELVFRINPPVSDYTSGLKDFFCNAVRPVSMAIVFENTRFGLSSAQEMNKWCLENFIEVLMTEPFDPWAADFEEVSAKIDRANADVLYVASNLRDSALFLRQFRKSGLEPKMLAGSMGTFNSIKFIKEVGLQSENIVTPAVWMPIINYPGVEQYVDRYKTKYRNLPDYHSAQAYAAVQVCRDVLERTASLDAADLLESLRTTDMMTVLGPVTFTSYKDFTNQNRLLTLVIQIQDGEFKTIWPPNAATVDCANCIENDTVPLFY